MIWIGIKFKIYGVLGELDCGLLDVWVRYLYNEILV